MDRRREMGLPIDRRTFLGASLAFAFAPLEALAKSEGLESALQTSPLVYISPLRSDGSESTCHGEVWYAWLDGAVVINTGNKVWKTRALERGLDGARIWVGDHGPWKKMLGRNEAFRQAPSFDARAERVKDEALLERLLATYEEKYPEEFGRWREPMRDGFHDGSRVLIRYSPL